VITKPPRGWLFYDQYLITKYIGWPCWMAAAFFVALFGNLLPRWMPEWAAILVVALVSVSGLVACATWRARRRASGQG
jgi:predicted lysophospholipase L1 biosynthesis ABC-type transport system permease subunit